MKYRAMTKKPWLFVLALFLFLLGMLLFFDVFIPWIQEDQSGDQFFVFKLLGYMSIGFFMLALFSEMFTVAIGIYQNQYTGSRFFKGILY